LGNNSTGNSSTPVQVSGIATAVAISGEEDAGLAVKSDGTAWAWGLNNNGQLGIGNTTDSHVPVQVHNLGSVAQVAGGLDDSIALKTDGTVWGWGLNTDGELGTGNTTSFNVPTQSNMSSVATSNGATTATYIYNGDGLTAGRTTGGATSQYTWATMGGSELPLIISDSTNDYVYGPSGTPVEQVALSNSTPTYMTYTPSDSSWLTTNSAGDQTGFWRYDAYGTLAHGTPTSPFGYSGQYTDAATGFVNDRARWYEPSNGGFTTRDPAFSQTDTAYTYAGDDPINSNDPTGLYTAHIVEHCQGNECIYLAGIEGTVYVYWIDIFDKTGVVDGETGWTQTNFALLRNGELDSRFYTVGNPPFIGIAFYVRENVPPGTYYGWIDFYAPQPEPYVDVHGSYASGKIPAGPLNPIPGTGVANEAGYPGSAGSITCAVV
jgi:RHS repeat-associated protein